MTTQLRRLIASLDNGTWGDEPIQDGSDMRCIRAADFDFFALRAKVESAPMRQVSLASRRKLLLKSGDLVLEKSGGGENQPVGRAVLFESETEAVCSNFAARLRPTPTVDSTYLAYLLSSLYFNGATKKCVLKTTGIQNLDTDAWLQTPVPDVGLGEQRRIADFLDDQVARIDNIIAARRSQLELLKAAASAEIDRLFGVQGTASASRLGRFVLGIEQGWSPQCESIPAESGEWGVVKVSAVRDGRFVPAENKRLPDELVPQTLYEIRSGDLLVTRANTPTLVGAFAVVPAGVRKRLLLCDKIMRIRLSSSLDLHYVSLVGRTTLARAALSGAGTGTSQSMVNIRGADIRDLAIPYRSFKDQQALIRAEQNLAAGTRAAVQDLAEQVALLAELKRSLITEAVTGGVDVSSADGSKVSV